MSIILTMVKVKKLNKWEGNISLIIYNLMGIR